MLMNSFSVCALIVLCANDYYSCCRPNIPEPKSNNSGLNIFFSSDKDIETKKRNDRINKLVECEMFMKGIHKDDFLSVAKLRTDVEGKINEFDKKITNKTCERVIITL